MQQIRPVRIGLILGILSILFGISWAVYIAAGHEAIHDTLRTGRTAAVVESEAGGMAVNEELREDGHPHGHDDVNEDDNHHDNGEAYEGVASEGGGAEEHGRHAAHDDPVMEEAHEMLARGHLHAMGLGLVTLSVSMVLAFVCAPGWLKTVGSVCVGAGGLLYPFSWITMGYKLPSLGMEAAEKAVLPIVGISVLLVLAGLVITFCCLVAGFFCRETS
jgi:hypothetical protein